MSGKMSANVTYSDAIEMAMRSNGGYATLGFLYKNVWKYKNRGSVRGRTPENTIQERVQRDRRFIRLGLGLYALKEYQEEGKLPKQPVAKTKKDKQIRQHTEIQGKIILIGNHRKEIADTYTPDKMHVFSGGKLGNIASLAKPHKFSTFKGVMKSVSYMDVVWFNERKFPSHLFEVEHSTNFVNALSKFCDLQDFNAEFLCISDESRRDKFESQVERPSFNSIKDRCRFVTYDQVESDYNSMLIESFI